MHVPSDLISADDHLDQTYLPADLWTKRMPEKFRDRAPHVEERNGQTRWICDGEDWGSWSGKAPPATGPKPVFIALDRGGITDHTELRPGVAELRLADMDRDGVYSHVLFGPVQSIHTDDKELLVACYIAYNDWLEEFCSVAPDRLIGVPMLPPEPEMAYDELSRLAKKGTFKQANIQIATAETPLSDVRWEPVFNLFEESGMIMSFHVTVFFKKAFALFDPLKGSPGHTFLQAKEYTHQFIDPFVDLFAWGILERHPKLKILIAEAGIGWVPWLVEELDYRHKRLWEAEEYWRDKGGIHLKTKPSDLFKRQVYGSFQDSHTVMRLIDFWGPDNLLWASDYPHPDSVWPNSHETIKRIMGHLPPEVVRKITHDNAAKLYNIKSFEVNQQLAAE